MVCDADKSNCAIGKNEAYDDWVKRVCEFLVEIGPEINMSCGTFQSRPILEKNPDVVFLGFNPNESLGFNVKSIWPCRFYKGNPDFYERGDKWKVWRKIMDAFSWAEFETPISDGHFVFFNAFYFGSKSISELKKISGMDTIIRKCFDFTEEVIMSIFKPKCIICFSITELFNELNKLYGFKNVEEIHTAKQTDKYLLEFALSKETSNWNHIYDCRYVLKKGVWDGIPIYGIPHPSARSMTNDDFGAIALYLRSEMHKNNIF